LDALNRVLLSSVPSNHIPRDRECDRARLPMELEPLSSTIRSALNREVPLSSSMVSRAELLSDAAWAAGSSSGPIRTTPSSAYDPGSSSVCVVAMVRLQSAPAR
jgi:hypothetical protein